MEQKIKRFWEANRKMLVLCLMVTLIWGLAAHAYGFLNFQLSHDSLDGLYGYTGEFDHKIELGRVFAPFYRMVAHGGFTAPWLIGCQALVWIALAVFLTAKMFDLHTVPHVAMLAGLMSVNLTVTAQSATFMNDLDANMFALMLCCLAALLWKKKTPGWRICGGLAVGFAIGLYQSYVSVTIALVMMSLMMELLDGEKPGKAIARGAGAAAMVLVGGLIYFAGVKVIHTAAEVPLAIRPNSVTHLENFRFSRLPELIGQAYAVWMEYFFNPHTIWLPSSVVRVVNIALLLLGVVALVCVLAQKKTSVLSKLLVVLLAALLPLMMNVCYLLTSGVVHDLMKYAFNLIFLLVLLLVMHANFKPVRWLCSALVCLLLWEGVVTANAAYLKKTSVWNATYAGMTNVVYDMLYYGYEPSETPVFISGRIPFADMPGFEQFADVMGLVHNNAVTQEEKSIKAYFRYVLGDDIQFCSKEEQEEIMATEDYEWMPCWPEEGYITIINDVMVVRLN